MPSMTLRLQDLAGLSAPRPVTGGVPLPRGEAPEGTSLSLHGPEGNAVPLQTQVLARWNDGSARWVLLDFSGQAPGNGVAEYTLAWGADADGAADGAAAGPAVTASSAPLRLTSGDVTLSAVDAAAARRSGALLRVGERLELRLTAIDADGRACYAVPEDASVEAAGPQRGTLALGGSLRREDGSRLFSFRMRASLYAESTLVRLEPGIIVDSEEGILQRIRDLRLTVAPLGRATGFTLGGEPSWAGAADQQARLFQVDDAAYRLEGAAAGEGGRAPGWAAMSDGAGQVALALREFWQQWPKSLEAGPEGLSLGLFPRFEAGAFDHMEPWYKYQYQFDGDCYVLRTGQARRWDVWMDLAGDGDALARQANAPLVPAADPVQAIATGVWDDILPAGSPEMAAYDEWAATQFEGYCFALEAQRDYGAMNWGDWFGERQVNWGNHEYDTTNQVLIQYARTGDPRYLYVAEAAARHSAEVDTIHHVNRDLDEYFSTNWPHPTYPSRPGMVHEHAVGHVGSFYPIEHIRQLFVEKNVERSGRPNPYLCLDPYNLGHIWTQGLVRTYFLTGDPFIRETVEIMGNNLALLVEDRQFKFMGSTHCGRITGWPLLALGGAYELTNDQRYLNAMRTLTEDALRDQDPVCGGWLIYPMAHDHCTCKTARHTGMAGFITAILINGMSRYYQLSGDERLPQAIENAVTFLTNDTWREENVDWRYTSCPASQPRMNQIGVVVMAYVNSVRYTQNTEHLRILRRAWEAKFRRLRKAPPPGPGVGKSFSATMYGCAEAVGLLERLKDVPAPMPVADDEAYEE